jgi:acyl-CoA synthetase (NDP forming)
MSKVQSSQPMKPMDRLLRPRSVAIVGASPTPGAFGAGVLANLEAAGYNGDLYLINPKRSTIGDRACLESVDALPEGVDCAVLAIPRVAVMETVRACARRKVGGVIIFSAGFAEAGEEGRAEQQQLGEIAREHNMIIEGPNCLGIVNYIDGVPLTFVVTPVRERAHSPGIAIVSQSGAMACVLSVSLRHHGLPLSFSVSTGNEAASGVEEFLEYMIDDPHTRVVAMIVEQFRKPKHFLQLVAKARAAGKHIVLLHPGSSSAARASAATHTGAMAGDYRLMRTKVEHAGVILVETLEELVDTADLLWRCPSLPSGGAAVFTESGAYKALTLDLCERLGLTLPSLGDATADKLRAVLPDFIPPTNPLDITAQGLVDPDLYRRCVPPVLADEHYGSLVLAIILTDESTSGLKLPPILEALKEIKPTKPVIFAGLDEGAKISHTYIEQLRELGVPFFPSAERAFRALAHVTRMATQQERLSTDQMSAATVKSPSLNLPSGTIPEYKSKEILAQGGIPIPSGALATNSDEAVVIAERIGYPVALKAQASALSHKSDAGGVALNLRNSQDVQIAWDKMQSDIGRTKPGLVLDGILVERMGRWGTELIVGVHNDPEWGPVLLVGLGGVLAEALGDSRLFVPGLSRNAIVAELLQLKSSALLRGFRGSPELDIQAVAEIISKLSELVLANPSIAEIDINPVIVYPKGEGAIALDALIVTHPAH